MHRPVYVAHSSFIKGSHTTKNMASGSNNVIQQAANVYMLPKVKAHSQEPLGVYAFILMFYGYVHILMLLVSQM